MSDRSNVTLDVANDQECNNKSSCSNNLREIGLSPKSEWPSFCSMCKQDLKSLCSFVPSSIEEKMHCHSLYENQELENTSKCSSEVKSINIELDDMFMCVKRSRELDDHESRDFLNKRIKMDLNIAGDLITRTFDNKRQETVELNDVEDLQGVKQLHESSGLQTCTKSQYFNETENEEAVQENHFTFPSLIEGKNNESTVKVNDVTEMDSEINLNGMANKDTVMMEIMKFQNEYDSFPTVSQLERIEHEAQKVNFAISSENVEQCTTVVPDNDISMQSNITRSNNQCFNAMGTNSVPEWMMKPVAVPEYNKLEASVIRRRKCVLEMARQLAKLSTYIENIRKTLLQKDLKNSSFKPIVGNNFGKSETYQKHYF